MVAELEEVFGSENPNIFSALSTYDKSSAKPKQNAPSKWRFGFDFTAAFVFCVQDGRTSTNQHNSIATFDGDCRTGVREKDIE